MVPHFSSCVELTVGDDGHEAGPDGSTLFDARRTVERQADVLDGRLPGHTGVHLVVRHGHAVAGVAARLLRDDDPGVAQSAAGQVDGRRRVAVEDDAVDGVVVVQLDVDLLADLDVQSVLQVVLVHAAHSVAVQLQLDHVRLLCQQDGFRR